LGKTWDVFKKTLPFLVIAGLGIFGFRLMHNAFEQEQKAYMNKCQQQGGMLVKVVNDNYLMCVKEVQVIKEKSNVSS
jgi:hypothetical protein